MFIIVIPTILYTILRTSAVQTFLAHKAASYLSKELNTEIKVGGVDITFYLNIVLEDLSVKDQHNNLLLYTKRFKINIHKLKYKKHKIKIDKITLENANIAIKKYKQDTTLNFQFLADYFNTKKSTSNKKWEIHCSNLDVINTHFIYQDLHKNFTRNNFDINNINLSGLNAELRNININKDTIFANINTLSFKEHSGFCIKNISTKLKISPVELLAQNLNIKSNNSNLTLDLSLNYKNTKSFNELINSIKIKSNIKPSSVNLNDIAYFIPEMKGMNNKIKISAYIYGNLKDLKIRKLILLYGKSTRFWSDITLNGLPDIKETYIHTSIKEFAINQKDLQTFKLAGKNGENKIIIPKELNKLGNIVIKGSFTGFYNDFVSYCDFYTDIGKLSTDICLKNNKINNKIKYNGKIIARNFDLGTILPFKNDFGKLNIDAEITGSGISEKTANIKLNGIIDSLDFKDYNYKNVSINAQLNKRKINGTLNIKDKNINLDFAGAIDLSKSKPAFDFITDISRAKLYKLNLTNRDSLSELTTKIKFDFQGDNIDDIQGSIKINNTIYKENNAIYKLKDIEIAQKSDTNGYKTLNFNSGFVDADIKGYFILNDLYPSFKKSINNFLPSFDFEDDSIFKKIPDQNFNYFINLKKINVISKLFLPKLIIAPNTQLQGSFNSKIPSITFNAISKNIEYNGIKFKNCFIKENTQNNNIFLNAKCNHLIFKNKTEDDTLAIGIDSLVFNSSLRNDSLLYTIFWNNNESINKNSGDIEGFAAFINNHKTNIKLNKANMFINDTLWTVSNDNYITIDTSSILVNDLSFINSKQQLKINGTISDNPSDKFKIEFIKLNISDFDLIFKNIGIDIKGFLNGNICLTNLHKVPSILSALKIENLYFNNEKLGDAFLKTIWNNNTNSLYVKSDVIYTGNIGKKKPLTFEGYYYPKNDTNNFDFNIFLKNYNLKTLTPVFSYFSTKLDGLATGNLKFSGTTENPKLTGEMKIKRTEMRIDYLNVIYSLSGVIDFEKNCINLDSIVSYDSLGNTAVINGKIYHHFFKKTLLDLNIHINNLSCLNTDATQNNMFYGNALATGDISIKGPVNNTVMNVKTKTNKGTVIYIPVRYSKDVLENNFINFINNIDTTHKQQIYKINLSGFTSNMNLDVTEDAKIQLLLPWQMGIIKVNGDGNIIMKYNTNGKFDIFGDYIMNQGSMLFTVQNIVNRNFIIRKGGKIKWTGDPYSADINMKAVYKVRASLNGLQMFTESNDDMYNKKIPVDCILRLKGKLSNPDISFNIELPNCDNDIKQLVYSAIDTTSKTEMNRQMFSLLVLKSFNFNSENNSIASSVGSSSFQVLSNQLNSMLSKISNDFDVGVNYHPGRNISDKELEVALSTQLFNDRVSIDGNFGVRGDENTQKASNIVGDVNVEAKITEDGRLRVKAFNKSNNIDLLNENAPYTQGIGIFYRKEFDKFSDLFKHKKNKRKKTKKIK